MNFCDKDGDNCWKCLDKELVDSSYKYKCKCLEHYYLDENTVNYKLMIILQSVMNVMRTAKNAQGQQIISVFPAIFIMMEDF